MTDTTSTPTTTHPCPDWCDGLHGDNDGFDIEISTGQPIRDHEQLVRGDGFLVWITAEELITPDGPMLAPITIGASGVDTDDCGALPPSVARKLADALWVAADTADTLEARR